MFASIATALKLMRWQSLVSKTTSGKIEREMKDEKSEEEFIPKSNLNISSTPPMTGDRIFFSGAKFCC